MNVVSIDFGQARRLANSVVLSQAVMTAVVALLSFAIAGRLAAVSALLGGGISTLASFAIATLSFRRSSAADPQRMVTGFYLGEAVKIVLVVTLFIVVFRTMKISPLPMFAAYMGTFLAYWIALANALPPRGQALPGSTPAPADRKD